MLKRAMKRQSALFVCLIASLLHISFSHHADADDRSMQIKQAQMKRDFEKRSREMKAEFERKSKEMKKNFEQRKAERESASTSSTRTSGTSSSSNSSSQSTPKVAFDPSKAPSPERCLAYFLVSARKATSVHEFLKYLPDEKQQSLKRRQERYDPADVPRSREFFLKNNPDMDEESLKFLTNPPFVNSLNYHKHLAGRVTKITGVEVDGNNAKIRVEVTSDVVVNGIAYTRGAATIGMVGEGSLWRFNSYSEDIMVSR
ncbi:hypothetical protein KOR42_27870 [Thalassoglobus neptunius]|uniref:Uncharacterized protein n=1 Tax=Thalassoglobus neptunius TaxID=1938619 RepID=A0A5C5WZ80_9PLAN|nr:hypothetical protein [Thalassoglobus neptunius]TWT55401.1 hypothetical protein KOR42_27870 [Thalassoglobus neptunius]